MTSDDRIALKEYMAEKFAEISRRFDSVDTHLTDLNGRLETLESDRDKRQGRRDLYGVAGRIVVASSAVLAAMAAFFGYFQN